MKINELRELSDEELKAMIAEHKEELFNLRFSSATGSLDKPHRINELRKAVARIKTILREREMKN